MELRQVQASVLSRATAVWMPVLPKGEEVNFNINDYVRVKLTERGFEILKKDAEEFRRLYPTALLGAYVPPKVDAEGYSKFQLWHLMKEFGPHITMGTVPPFGTIIDIGPKYLTIPANFDIPASVTGEFA